MCSSLTDQVRSIAKVTTAVARGDLTQKIDTDMMWNIAVNDAGAAYDPLTLLRSRTLFGRPDFPNIYQRLRMSIESGQYLPGAGTASMRTNVGVCWFFISKLTLADS